MGVGIVFLAAFGIYKISESNKIASGKNITVVGVQPYYNMGDDMWQVVLKGLDSIYGFDAVLLDKKQLPPEAYTEKKGGRFYASKLLQKLSLEKPDSVDYILGITDMDICYDKKDNGKIKEPTWKYECWGIFGLATIGGTSCVISTSRPSWKKNCPTHEIFLECMQKIAVHEIGHDLGLSHCKSDLSEKCVMLSAAESITRIRDEVELKLCARCRTKFE